MRYIKIFESFTKEYNDMDINYSKRIEDLKKERLSSLKSLLNSYREKIDEYLLQIVDTYKPNFQFFEKNNGRKKIFQYEWRVTNFKEIDSIRTELIDFKKRMDTNFPTFVVKFGYSFRHNQDHPIYSPKNKPQSFCNTIDEMISSFDTHIPNFENVNSINFKVRISLD
jgi:hypothetical protein